MTRGEFASAMAYLGAGIGRSIPEEQLEVYFNELRGLHPEDFREAVRLALRGLQENFLPSIGVLYRLACESAQRRIHHQESQERVRHDRQQLQGILDRIGRLPETTPDRRRP